jgi:peroxiredoxin Q/BCP
MPLTVGDKAPPFVLPASTGQDISLQALAGKTIVLYFYPRDDTPGCTKEACGFRDTYEALKASGIAVLGVSADSLRAHTKFAEKYHLPFPLLSDTEKTVATAYGAWGEKKVRGRPVVGMKRMTFLIDAAGTMQRIWSTVQPDGHATEVLAHARKGHSMTASQTTTQPQAVDFYFDPSCPWAWRTALWIREVAKVRPIQVTWKFLSLARINEANDYARDSHTASHATFPLLARARERFGNDAVERLYVALGQARHERKESLGDPVVIEKALVDAGLDPAWRTEAATDPGIEERIMAEHKDGVERHGAFGVPTISISGQRGFFGPVINSVPTGEDAGELWDHMAWLSGRGDFFEYKRSRK